MSKMQGQKHYREMPKDARSKLKKEAVAFYAQHNVTDALETLLNHMFLEKPDDVYGYMSEYFHRLSLKPVISAVKGSYQFDGRGHHSLALSMQCKINGVDKAVCAYTHPIVGGEEERREQLINSSAKGLQMKQHKSTDISSSMKHGETDIKESTAEGEGCVEQPPPDALECLKHFEEKMKGLSPCDQVTVDSVIAQVSSTLDTPIHPATKTALSCLSALTSSALLETPLYLHLLESFGKLDGRLSLPIPLVSVISGGQHGIGKFRARSYLVSPSPTVDISEGAKYIIDLYKEVGHQLSLKQGPLGCATLPDGSFCLAADRPEQALDFLRESAVQAGLELNREVSMYIDMGADTLYDCDKKKYEIASGQWKTADELIVLYTTLLTSYPGLIGFMNPLHSKDHEGWSSLIDQLGDKCLLFAAGDCSENFLPQEMTAECSSSGEGNTEKSLLFVTCSTLCANGSLISDCFKDAIKLKGFGRYLMLLLDCNQTIHSLKFLMELAVALKCKFVKLSAPAGLGSLVALSQMVELQADLKARSLLRPSSALLFSCSQLNNS